MRLSSSFEVDADSVVFHSITDVCHVECPNGSTCFFDYNVNAFACNAIMTAVQQEKEEEEQGQEVSEWPIAHVPSTTARQIVPIPTTIITDEIFPSTLAGVSDIVPSGGEMGTHEASTIAAEQGDTTTSERPEILPVAAADEEIIVIDSFPNSGREDDSTYDDDVTSMMPESSTIETSTAFVTSTASVANTASPTERSLSSEIPVQSTEIYVPVEKTPKSETTTELIFVTHDSAATGADAQRAETQNTTEANKSNVESSTSVDFLTELPLENATHSSDDAATVVSAVAGFVPIETEVPAAAEAERTIGELTTEAQVTTITDEEPAPSESAADIGTTKEILANLEPIPIMKAPGTDVTSGAEPGFVVTKPSVENEQTAPPESEVVIATTSASEFDLQLLEDVTDGSESSIHGEAGGEAVTETLHHSDMTTRLSEVLSTTLRSITESILRGGNLTDNRVMEFQDALSNAFTEISTSTTPTTTEQSTSTEQGSSVDFKIPIIKDPAEVEQKLQELVANVTMRFKATTQTYDDVVGGATESPPISELNDGVTNLVPGFVSTFATTDSPKTVSPNGDEDEPNAAVPRNLHLNESELLHNALVTEGTNECQVKGMFSCGSGCIGREKRCDLIVDCNDGSDEINCGKYSLLRASGVHASIEIVCLRPTLYRSAHLML